MVTNNKLSIFLNFSKDFSLLKFKKNDDSNNISVVNGNFIPIGGNDSMFSTPSISNIRINNDGTVSQFYDNSIDYINHLRTYINELELSTFRKILYHIFLTILPLFLKKDKKIKVQNKIIYPSIKDFFTTLVNQKLVLKKSKTVFDTYEKMINNAKVSGQTALIERLLKEKDVVSQECKLIEDGITTYVTEEQVVKLYNTIGEKTDLQLTWIKNFVRIIPDECIELKNKADQSLIFDNYVILHYDPKRTGFEYTEKEIEEIEEKKKDPIMFGVIEGSNKLYFICDWVDEICDLTMEKMMDLIDSNEFKLTNKSVKSYLTNNIK